MLDNHVELPSQTNIKKWWLTKRHCQSGDPIILYEKERNLHNAPLRRIPDIQTLNRSKDVL